MTYGSQAAAASQVFEQQRDLALRDRATTHLVLVDAALARLDGGTYGALPPLRPADRPEPPRGAALGRLLHRLPAGRRSRRALMSADASGAAVVGATVDAPARRASTRCRGRGRALRGIIVRTPLVPFGPPAIADS